VSSLSQLAPSFGRTCRALLTSADVPGSDKILGFISALPNEGVSTVSVGIAEVLAMGNKVLLVDAGTGRETISSLLNLEPRPVLPSNLTSSPRTWIVQSKNTRIDLLTLEPTYDSAALCERALSELQSSAATRYRFVLVDLGSLQTLLCPAWVDIVHRVYIVVDSGRASSESLEHARKELDLLRLPVAGAIMNRRPPSARSYFLEGSV
jgi:Mrp family chromosome partitioning ATPase